MTAAANLPKAAKFTSGCGVTAALTRGRPGAFARSDVNFVLFRAAGLARTRPRARVGSLRFEALPHAYAYARARAHVSLPTLPTSALRLTRARTRTRA